jgi:hypothetical protein
MRTLPKVLFADTYILIGLTNGTYPVLNALKAGHLRTATVYYNETVHNEYNALNSTALPSNFVHIPSRLDITTKQAAYRAFVARWNIPNSLNEKHRRKFMSDLYMIFEASFKRLSVETWYTCPCAAHQQHVLVPQVPGH